jgi:hypothetical protein
MPRNYDTDETEMFGKDESSNSTTAVAEAPAKRLLRGGWSQVDAMKSADSQYAQRLKVTEEVQIVKFLEDEPYVGWHQHWVEREGQKSFVCIREIDERGCPICETGVRPSQRVAFNVALLTSGEKVANRSFEVGPRVVDQLRNLNKAPQTGPLSKHYWAVSRSGKGATTSYNLQVVRERDLADEWKVSPISEEGMLRLQDNLYDASIIKVPTYADLAAIAAEIGN